MWPGLRAMLPPAPTNFGDISLGQLLTELQTTADGLSSEDARRRQARELRRLEFTAPGLRILLLFLAQFRSPITLILIAAALLSLMLGAVTDSFILLTIVLAGALIGFWQEFTAANALAALQALVAARVTVLRDGQPCEIELSGVVPGDIAVLSAGSIIPGDCRILAAEDLFVDEAMLTGESYPVEKHARDLPPAVPLAARVNTLFQGTHVISGTARAVVALTGAASQMGQIGGRLRLRPPESDFERGVRRFGNFLLEITLLLVFLIFLVHLAVGRPALEAFLFSLALAVGLTPQLLPAIIAVNLAQGARQLATRRVIVRRLPSIENFGSMNVFCCDKTGTLTEGRMRVQECVDAEGRPNPRGLQLAALNAMYETGFSNPIDAAIRAAAAMDAGTAEKLDEIPYDFQRRRLSVLVRENGKNLLIVKGAWANVVAVCAQVELTTGLVPLPAVQAALEKLFYTYGTQGFRVLAVAYRQIDSERLTHEMERDLVFSGLLILHDPLRNDIQATLQQMQELGIALKIITGDNRVVASSVANGVGLQGDRVLTGEQVRQLSDEALALRAAATEVFAEIEPNQKERIVLALRRAGRVVGFMGDGINDATALHAADVGISVDQAVDVAKQAADIVLLDHSLQVLVEGVRQGRATFANTLKYIFLATSANFGNMFSMAGISVALNYLPLLPKQILLTNLLTDLPELTIARDRVDPEWIAQPQRWDIHYIQRFMLAFGLLSSLFDYATFGVLLGWLRAGADEFRTGWFVESVVSACVIVLIVRSRRPLLQSRPARSLLWTTCGVIVATIALPYSPLAKPLGFVPLPAAFLATMFGIVALYAASAEGLKRWFFAAVAPSKPHRS